MRNENGETSGMERPTPEKSMLIKATSFSFTLDEIHANQVAHHLSKPSCALQLQHHTRKNIKPSDALQ